MSETVCNYTNYETFHVAIFLSNNRPQYDKCLRFAKGCLEGENPVGRMANVIEELVSLSWLNMDEREEACKADTDYLAHSLLTAALGRVDWKQIAEEWITTAQEK